MRNFTTLILRITAAIAFFVGPECAIAADFSAGPQGVGVLIEGKIKPGDFQKYTEFRNANVSDQKLWAAMVTLNSPGGDVAEALKFAESFTSEFASTYIPSDGKCFSACTLMWAGGVDRTILGHGQLGFHRLSFTNREIDVKKSKAILEPANTRIAEFLKTVGLPSVLIDKMNETAPTDLFIVDPDWLVEHGLDLAIRYQPVFLDVAEKQCGVDPTTVVLKFNLTYTQEVKSKYGNWLVCTEAVKEANRQLQYKEYYENVRKQAREQAAPLGAAKKYVIGTKWTMMVDDYAHGSAVYADIKNQTWIAKSTQLQMLVDNRFDRNHLSSFFTTIRIDCEAGTVMNVAEAFTIFCDGSMCKEPNHINKNESALAKKVPDDSLLGALIKVVCTRR